MFLVPFRNSKSRISLIIIYHLSFFITKIIASIKISYVQYLKKDISVFLIFPCHLLSQNQNNKSFLLNDLSGNKTGSTIQSNKPVMHRSSSLLSFCIFPIRKYLITGNIFYRKIRVPIRHIFCFSQNKSNKAIDATEI